ncbi:rhomboid-related protein 1-like [Rhynchophorus ferrugineus]|uniref:rhomboid-related protein 1-like n=1 Tax=Rhynchophorus ferrugineus TaxID=354439 RepID=UPI003FCC7C20
MGTNAIQDILNRFVKLIIPPRQRRPYGPVGRRNQKNGTVQTDGVYDDEYCFWPPQMGIIVITIIQVIFFVIDETTDSDDIKIGTGKMAEMFIYDPLKKKEVWRFLTYMFVHVRYVHIITNALVQLTIGFPLESVHKWWRVLIIYFLGVIAGSLLTSVIEPNVKLAGASGGVYAILTAHIATVIMNFKDMSYGCVHLGIILTAITVDVGSFIYYRYTKTLDVTVGYAAHFAGALVGLLVGIWILRNIDPTKKEKYLWWGALLIYIVLMVVLIILTTGIWL